MVVIKLVVKEPSEKRKRRQLLPTPTKNEQKQMASLASITVGTESAIEQKQCKKK